MALPKDYDARKALPLYDFLTKYFPDAIVELVKVCVVGNAQHNPGEPLHWARGKSMDQLNTAQRHMLDHGAGAVFDESDDGRVPGMRTRHLAKAAWRLLAQIQLDCEAPPSDGDDGAPEARDDLDKILSQEAAVTAPAAPRGPSAPAAPLMRERLAVMCGVDSALVGPAAWYAAKAQLASSRGTRSWCDLDAILGLPRSASIECTGLVFLKAWG